MSSSIVKNMLSEMKLRGMLHSLDIATDQAMREDLSYSEFLAVLLQSELDYKRETQVEQKIKNAKLRLKPELEEYDYTVKRSLSKAQIKELYSLNWLKKGQALVLIGKTGIGKSFLAQAIGLHACRNNLSTVFLDITTLLENLSLQRAAGAYLKYKERISRPDLLIIDDFGLRKLNSVEAQDFCEIIEARSIDKATIITTQLPFKHWGEVIQDPVIADAIIDRLIHGSLVLDYDGETYRKTKALKMAKEISKK